MNRDDLPPEVLDCVSILTEQMLSGRCVLFLGSGVSATYTDGRGRVFPGVPCGSELLAILQQERRYVMQDTSLLRALSIKYTRERRTGLLDFIMTKVGSCRTPLPAHDEIAKLPLTAILTTNWDTLLEKSLDRRQVSYHTVIKDTDIPMIRPGSIPFVKFHGSLHRPETIVATFADILDLFAKRPVVASLLRVLCAQCTLLFLGYALEDPDFQDLFRGLQRELGDYMPATYAIQRAPAKDTATFWTDQGVTIVDADLTEFLQILNATILHRGSAVFRDSATPDSWMKDPFLRRVLGAGTLPSESQVIDAALELILQLLDSDASLDEIGQRVREAVEKLVEVRPHFQALRRIRSAIVPQWFPPQCVDQDEARRRVAKYLLQRGDARRKIGDVGAAFLSIGDSVLLYSQSTRVLEVIKRWMDSNKGSGPLNLVIPECRPKCSQPFQEALAIADAIPAGAVTVTLIPDAAVAYFLEHGKVNKVFMGAHSVIDYGNKAYSVTNTTGAMMVARLAMSSGVPVFVFAEEEKVFPIEPGRDSADVSEAEPPASGAKKPLAEELIIDETHGVFADVAVKHDLRYVNPGYDDLHSSELSFTLITESRVISVGPGESEGGVS